MRLSRKGKVVLGILISLILVPLVALVLIYVTPKPPENKVEYARLTLSQAALSNAESYSRKEFKEARRLYDSAMLTWQIENERFIFFRDYSRVEQFAELSAKKAVEAMENSKISLSTLETKIKLKIDSLNVLIVHINRIFKAYPLSPELWKRISRGHMLLKESEVAYYEGQYIQANKKITDSEYLLTTSYEKAAMSLKEYFDSYPVWQKWVDNTINDSRRNKSYSLIIDKYSRKCVVYHNGIKKYEYKVELGQNWVGDKKVKGDKATPEGMYRIVKKLGSNKTKYYKALLLDYPNETDLKEFKKEIAQGTLPRSAKIGSLIEIHGNGGKGVDWTEGCIALIDEEMDVIFRVVQEGTPVTIVGSINELKQVLN